jgi:hypothetical protein
MTNSTDNHDSLDRKRKAKKRGARLFACTRRVNVRESDAGSAADRTPDQRTVS